MGRDIQDFVYTRAEPGGTCEPSPLDDGRRFVTLGRPIDLDSLQRVESRRVGTGRLRAERSHVADTVLGDAGEFWDAERELRCTPRPFCDGSFRCVPDGHRARHYFGDPDCGRSLIRLSEPAEQAYYTLVALDGSCPREARTARALGEPHTGPVYYVAVDGGCYRRAPEGSAHFYRAEADVTDRLPRVWARVE